MKEAQNLKEVIEFINNIGYNHPLVTQACTNLSIDSSQLYPKQPNDFISQCTSKEMSEVWFKHYEARRRAKITVIARFFIENKIVNASNDKNLIIRSFSSRNTYRNSSNISPKFTLNDNSDPKIETIKKNIIKKLTVEKNLQRLKVSDENKRKVLENKLKSKSNRNENRITPDKLMQFEKHDRRIKEILSKKYKKIEDHEKSALRFKNPEKEDLKTHSLSFYTPQKKESKSRFHKTPEIDPNQRLSEINTRLNKSTERAKKALIEKANSGSLLFNQTKRVKLAQHELELRNEEKNFNKISKMQSKFIESCVKII